MTNFDYMAWAIVIGLNLTIVALVVASAIRNILEWYRDRQEAHRKPKLRLIRGDKK